MGKLANNTAAAALMEQQKQLIARLERELQESKQETQVTKQTLTHVHMEKQKLQAEQTKPITQPANSQPPRPNGEVSKNAFLPWLGEILKYLPLNTQYVIKLINHSRFKESKEYGKQLLLDIHFPVSPVSDMGSNYTWSLRVDDPRITRILDLQAQGKPIRVYRDEYKDEKTGQTKSVIKIA